MDHKQILSHLISIDRISGVIVNLLVFSLAVILWIGAVVRSNQRLL